VTKRIIISAVSLNEGGGLTVLRECLLGAVAVLGSDWEIIALVHDKHLADDIPGVNFLEFPKSRHSWFIRFYYEFWVFRQLSIQFKPDVWLSLHNVSPWVKTTLQCVYCHNSLPFYKMSMRQALWEPRSFVHTIAYRYLYRLNIHSNKFIVVQQQWLRDEFCKLYGLKNSDVIVAYPLISFQERAEIAITKSVKKIFFYPSLSRVWKNFELICEAASILERRGVYGYEVRLTISPDDNRYTRYLSRRYSNVLGINFIGRQSPVEMQNRYSECDTVLFPSTLETWGLPISEAKAYAKPLMVADLPYAREAVGNYNAVVFFDPFNPEALANLMHADIEGNFLFERTQYDLPAQPFMNDWSELITHLTDGIR
jgi:glycosyltransferase involved in cell wall biosynthesis